MTSIVNFEEKIMDRPSNVIFDYLNRLNASKLSGAPISDELAKIIVLAGDLIANEVSHDRFKNGDIDQVIEYLTCFTGENRDKYLKIKHKDLGVASITSLREIDIAREEQKQRNASNNYSRGLRKAS